MSGTKISAAADAGTLTATDMLPVARSGSTTAYHATMAEIATWANTNLPVASTTVAGVSKVDGSTITVSSGTLSGAAASPALPAMDGGTGSVGVATGFSRGDHVHPTDTTRAPLASPTFTGSPAAPTPTTGDNSTKLATTAFVQAQMVASGAGVSTFNTRAGAVVLQQSDLVALGEYNDTGRNAIHNPGFTVAQRGAGPWTTGTWTLDRWFTAISNDTFSVSQVALADADRAAIGDEAAQYAWQNVFTGNAAAGAYNVVGQRIEKVSRLSGKTITLSFWARCASGALKIGINFIQGFGTGGSPSSGIFVLATGLSVTISTTWARYSVTLAVPSIAGKTLGTNGDDYFAVQLYFSSGATSNALAGNIGVQSGTIQLWGVQLEVGSVATPLARRDPQQELALAERFYVAMTANVIGYVPGNANPAGQRVIFPTTMRGTPSVTISGGSFSNCSSVTFDQVDNRGCRYYAMSTAAGLVSVDGFTLIASADL